MQESSKGADLGALAAMATCLTSHSASRTRMRMPAEYRQAEEEVADMEGKRENRNNPLILMGGCAF